MSKNAKAIKKPATMQDIRAIVGPVGQEIIKTIAQTGATAEEVFLASDSLEKNNHILSASIRPMPKPVRHVYEILDYARFSMTVQ